MYGEADPSLAHKSEKVATFYSYKPASTKPQVQSTVENQEFEKKIA